MDLNKLEHFCLFIGYPRSGHSLVGSIIDAHKNAIISHELNFCHLIRKGSTRQQVLNRIIQNSSAAANKGRKGEKLNKDGSRGSYNYFIPGQHHGKSRNLLVVGDKRANDTTLAIGHDVPLGRVEDFFGLDLKIVHVIRDPYDNVATMTRAIGKNAFGLFERLTKIVLDIRKTHDVLDLHLADLIDKPGQAIKLLMRYLGLKHNSDYINACSSIIFNKPNRTSKQHDWGGNRDKVTRTIDGCEWFDRYK
jgi:hypothetical protein